MTSGTGPLITTDLVELRLLTPRSAQQLLRLASDAELTRYLQWPTHQTIDDSLAFIGDARRLWEQELAFLPGIFDRATEQLVGSIGLSAIDVANRRAEVGTWIGSEFQRAGYNRHAKAAMLTYAFRDVGLERIEFIVRSDNEHSIASISSMPGIVHEGRLRNRLITADTAHDGDLFALIRSDWDPAAWPDAVVTHAPSWRDAR